MCIYLYIKNNMCIYIYIYTSIYEMHLLGRTRTAFGLLLGLTQSLGVYVCMYGAYIYIYIYICTCMYTFIYLSLSLSMFI